MARRAWIFRSSKWSWKKMYSLRVRAYVQFRNYTGQLQRHAGIPSDKLWNMYHIHPWCTFCPSDPLSHHNTSHSAIRHSRSASIRFVTRIVPLRQTPVRIKQKRWEKNIDICNASNHTYTHATIAHLRLWATQTQNLSRRRLLSLARLKKLSTVPVPPN